MFSFIDDVGGDTLLGGRLFKTSDVEQHGANITAAYRGLINAGVIIGGHIGTLDVLFQIPTVRSAVFIRSGATRLTTCCGCMIPEQLA
jgi:hypothetical protein